MLESVHCLNNSRNDIRSTIINNPIFLRDLYAFFALVLCGIWSFVTPSIVGFIQISHYEKSVLQVPYLKSQTISRIIVVVFLLSTPKCLIITICLPRPRCLLFMIYHWSEICRAVPFDVGDISL